MTVTTTSVFGWFVSWISSVVILDLCSSWSSPIAKKRDHHPRSANGGLPMVSEKVRDKTSHLVGIVW
jgi:hypothetical protein